MRIGSSTKYNPEYLIFAIWQLLFLDGADIWGRWHLTEGDWFSCSSQRYLSEKIRPYRESGYISQASVPQKRITVSVSGTKGLNRELDASKITEEAGGTEVRGLPDCWLKSHITIPMTQSGNHRCLQTMDLEMYQWDI